jgi:hypothetical protein
VSGWNRGLRALAIASVGLAVLAATHFYFEWALFTETMGRHLIFGGSD